METPCTSIRFTEKDKADLNTVKEKFGVKNVSAVVRLGFRILIRLSETPEGTSLVYSEQEEMA